MKKTIIIIAVLALVIIAGGVTAFLVLFNNGNTEKKVELTSYSPGEYFVTNIKDANKLLKVSVVLGLDNPKLVEEFKEKNYIIRDAIIFILRDVTEERFRSDDVKQSLGYEIRDKLNEAMETESIQDVWFEDFVMQ